VEPANHTGAPEKPPVSEHESEDEVSPKAVVTDSHLGVGGRPQATSRNAALSALGRRHAPTMGGGGYGACSTSISMRNDAGDAFQSRLCALPCQ
jgi:hypothetical protein